MKPSGPLFASGQAAVVSAFLLMVPAISRAVEITVEPPMPTAGDRVQVVVHGVIYRSSGPTCFAPCVNVSCWPLNGRTFGIGVCDYPAKSTSTCKGDGPSGTLAYGEIGRSHLGALAAGRYTLQVTIYDATSPNPRIESISFDVANATPHAHGDFLRLESVGPHPARGTFVVAAILPNDSPATVAVYDVRGRLVKLASLEGLGPRRQLVRLGADDPFPAGVYFVRLTQGLHVVQLKEVLLR